MNKNSMNTNEKYEALLGNYSKLAEEYGKLKELLKEEGRLIPEEKLEQIKKEYKSELELKEAYIKSLDRDLTVTRQEINSAFSAFFAILASLDIPASKIESIKNQLGR